MLNPEEGHASGPREALWYAVPYFEQVRDYLRSRGVRVEYLYREEAVRAAAWARVEELRPSYFVGVGHGSATTYTGFRLNKILWVDMVGAAGLGGQAELAERWNPEWGRRTVFLLLSCVTARELGPWMANSGMAWSYLGWDHLFGFIANVGKRKGADWRESPDVLFLGPVEEAFARCAAAELSPGATYVSIRSRYSSYVASPEVPERWKALLRHDMIHMRVLGGLGNPPGVPGVPRVPRELLAAAAGAAAGLAVGAVARALKK